MPPEPTQKPEKPKPYQRKPKVPVLKDAPKTSARMVKEKHKNSTLHEKLDSARLDEGLCIH
jgi:hypothetical protein